MHVIKKHVIIGIYYIIDTYMLHCRYYARHNRLKSVTRTSSRVAKTTFMCDVIDITYRITGQAAAVFTQVIITI